MSALKTKRVAAGIPGSVLCAKAGLSRSRLSLIEQGYLNIPAEERDRINTVLDDLIRVKTVIRKTEAELGWPGAEVPAGV